jgi:hypothetical protein
MPLVPLTPPTGRSMHMVTRILTPILVCSKWEMLERVGTLDQLLEVQSFFLGEPANRSDLYELYQKYRLLW